MIDPSNRTQVLQKEGNYGICGAKKRDRTREGNALATLKEIAVSYRATADDLRHRIQLVQELPARTEAEALLKQERLRLLEAMRRDVRDMAVICERYYEPGYRICDKYHI